MPRPESRTGFVATSVAGILMAAGGCRGAPEPDQVGAVGGVGAAGEAGAGAPLETDLNGGSNGDPVAAERSGATLAELPPDAAELAESLVIAVRSVPAALDPLGDLDPWTTRVVQDAVFEGLTRRTEDGAPWAEPALADTCVLHPVDAPRDAYCHLAPGRTFHDGSPVAVDDVVYSLQYWLDPRRGSLRAHHGLSGLRRVEVVDAPPGGAGSGAGPDPGRWIRIGSEDVDPLLLERIAEMPVVPQAAHRGHATRFSRAPVGSGPMRVVEVGDERLVLEAVAPDARTAHRIVLLQVRDGAAAMTGLRRGDIHIVAAMSPSHVPSELAKPGMASRFTAWVRSPPVYDLVLYNVRRGPPAGPRLRTALDLALPRAEVATALGGTPPSPVTAPVDLEAPLPIDLRALEAADAAAHLGMGGLPAPVEEASDASGLRIAGTVLDELGWVHERGLRRRGTATLRLVLMWNGEPGVGRTVAQAVRDAWRELGVHVPYATASWSYLMGPLRRGEYDLALGRLAEHSDADLYPYFHSKGDLNVPGVADPDLDAALVAYREARTSVERQAAKERIAARLSELRVVSVLRAPTEVLVASRRVVGLRFVDDLPVLHGMHLGPPPDWELGKL